MEFLFPGGPYKNTESPRADPAISNIVFQDGLQLVAGKSTLLSEDLSATGIHAAKFESAAVPQDIAIDQYPIGAGSGSSLGLGEDAHREFIVPRLGREFHQPTIGADKGVAFSVRLDGEGPGDGLEGTGDLFKAIARKMVEAKVSTNKKRTIGCVAKGSA